MGGIHVKDQTPNTEQIANLNPNHPIFLKMRFPFKNNLLEFCHYFSIIFNIVFRTT
jgi:hypothetical protein